jgi:hypothetical protein
MIDTRRGIPESAREHKPPPRLAARVSPVRQWGRSKTASPEGDSLAMKRSLRCIALSAATALFCVSTVLAQNAPASPPETATGTIGGVSVTIKYSSPRVKGREGKIFSPGGLISHDPHYPVWRAGANSATALHTTGNLKIGDVSVPAGDYTLFVDISNPDQWTLIVSKDTKEWGLRYDNSKDLGKTSMTMSKPPSMVEDLTWTISSDSITLSWEDHSASVPASAQ